MNAGLVIFSFTGIAIMRVVQKVCSKKVSNSVEGKESFRYGGYYQLLSTLFSLITLAIVGFNGFNWQTILCGMGTAIFLAIELFTGIEALKGCSLIVSQMFSVGALFIPCIVGIFLFDEPMSICQWVGLLLFTISMYFLIAPTKKKNDDKPKKMALRTWLMLIICMLASGGTMVVQKVFSVLVPNGNVATYSFLMFAFSAVLLYGIYFFLCIIQRKETKIEKMDNKWKPLTKVLLICGGFLAFAVFVINMLVTELGKTVESAILFSVSYAISIIITILVGTLYYKEKINVKNVIGIVLCVGSLAIINFL